MNWNCFVKNWTRRTASERRPVFLLIAVLTGVVAASGCGGGGGSTQGALVRAVNTSTNGGQATVYFNGTNYNGTVAFSLASIYLNLDSGTETFSFTLSAQSGATYGAISQALSAGSYYSAIVFGRSDITSAADPRYPKVEVASDDPTTPPAGDTRLRIVQAAPDATSVDLLIDNQVAASNVAYSTIGSYSNLAGGNHTFQVNQAGTTKVLVPAQTLSPAAGLVYSVFILETAVTPSPTYSVVLVGDAR